MRLLAIDTALEACAVGVAVDGQEPILLTETIGRGHAERLFPILAAALATAGLRPTDFERIVLTVGPGSFTGIRVGLAAARGLGLATGIPVVGIGTLEVHGAEAARAAAGRPVLAALDAKHGDVYGQFFDEGGIPLGTPAAASAADFAERARAMGAALAGSGADAVATAGAGTLTVIHRRSAPDLVTLLALGRRAPHPAGPPRPLYLRQADAKPRDPPPARP